MSCGRYQPVRHRRAHQQPACEVEGEYTARFAVGAGDALTYQGITALTGAADDSQWGSATPDPHGRGWWLTGTRNTGGTGCVADCKTMDTAFVPLTALTHPSAWRVQLGVLPSGEGYDLGTVVSMSHASGHGWFCLPEGGRSRARGGRSRLAHFASDFSENFRRRPESGRGKRIGMAGTGGEAAVGRNRPAWRRGTPWSTGC